MTRRPEPGEFLDIQMQQIARRIVFVALDGCGRFQSCQAVESSSLEKAADCTERDTGLRRYLVIGLAVLALIFNLINLGAWGGMGTSMWA